MWLALLGCSTPPVPETPASPGPSDVRSTDLSLDLETLAGTAVLDVAPADGAGEVRLEVGDLTVTEVSIDGTEAEWSAEDGVLRVATDGSAAVTVRYGFSEHDEFDGWMPSYGLSFVWPYWCGNLFPCVSDPSDGTTFTLELSGYEGTAVHPEAIPSPAPAYMLGFAVGEYTETELGTTSAGTRVSTWTLPGEAEYAAEGTVRLMAAFDHFERTYGAYSFGDHVGSVSAPWDGVGGMEHHPYWHVASWSLRSEEAHVHEAMHGWYGDGVRIACWEDLVLSEGTTTYATARALLAVGGPDIFDTYVDTLDSVCAEDSGRNAIAMPDTCGAIDILTDPLWSMVPYMKGACFFTEVAALVGPDVVDGVIASFYAEHVGGAAEMEDMVEALRAEVPAEAQEDYDRLVTEWLRTLACPSDYASRCVAPPG